MKFSAPLIVVLFLTFLLTSSTVQAVITSTGNIEPNDPGSWDLSTWCYIGRTSDATLMVNEGSDLSSMDAFIGYSPRTTAEVTIDDPGSTWTNSDTLTIGHYGNSTLNVTNGAVIDSNKNFIGRYIGSKGEVTIDGVGSTWTSREKLVIGNDGSGRLNITNGGVVTGSGIIAAGFNSRGDILVSGKGSTWACNSDVLHSFHSAYIGFYGSGTLSIVDGGTVYCNQASCIAMKSGSTGKVMLDGPDSAWINDGDLFVGESGSGFLSIAGGAKVDVQGNTWAAHYLGSNGGIDFDHGTLSITGSILAGETQMTGVGTIHATGIISDVDMTLSSVTDLKQTLVYDELPNQNITIHLDMEMSPEYLGAGYTGNGSLTIRNGMEIHSAHGDIGYHFGSTGKVTVDGNDSTWVVSQDYEGSFSWMKGHYLTVGHYGNGTLNITNGAKVRLTANANIGRIGRYVGSVGKVMVEGSDSLWSGIHYIHVGEYGEGSLDILDGGTVTSNYARIAFQEGSVGKVTVDGNGSTWINKNDNYIGDKGNAQLEITNGGKVTNSRGFVGGSLNASSEVTVKGIGSIWTNGSMLYIGGNCGSLTILDGGVVNNFKEGLLGPQTGSTGKATVKGTGSVWNSASLFVGEKGTGKLDIMDHGLVRVSGILTIDLDLNGDSFINMTTGGMLALKGNADDSLDDFLDLVEGTDAIRWWDESINDWAPLTTATVGTDYTLEYLTEGELAGYTRLTVGTVPEPGTVALILSGFLALWFGIAGKKYDRK